MTLPTPSRSMTVTLVITTYNDAHFLDDAMASVRSQTRPVDQILVVDDGSDPSRVPDVDGWPDVTLIVKENGGLASARNAGLAQAVGDCILFLDVDDRLTPDAVEFGCRCLEQNPDAAFVYGAHRMIDFGGSVISAERYAPIGPLPFFDLLYGNQIGMHAAVLYRREALCAVGGFDETLRLCEDYDVYLRIARRHAVASHDGLVAEYRLHADNISRDARRMLEAALDVHARYRSDDPVEARAWRLGRHELRKYYLKAIWRGRASEVGNGARVREAGSVATSLVSRLPSDVLWPQTMNGFETMTNEFRTLAGRIKRRLLRGIGARINRPKPWPPEIGKVDFGDFAEPRPVSLDFGFDRGLPVDRVYIEKFLAKNSDAIKGRVLEIGDASYSRRFGGAEISMQDVLHVNRSGPDVTIQGDLSTPGVLPEAAFDCIILTQTLHLIYDFDAALRRIHESLKPGGIALVTVPGISQIDRGEWGDNWFWSFTGASIRRMFSSCFEESHLSIEVHGNVFAATAFLQGVAAREIDVAKLEPFDPAYPVVVTVRAQRARA